MRRGEILGLTRKQVNLSKRIIVLSPETTKEAHWKRVPIHKELIPILEGSLERGTQKVTSLSNKVFCSMTKKDLVHSSSKRSKMFGHVHVMLWG
ncbi:hypothetical protein [Desulfomonile tiedjei]|uniref:hypothetical protein n=1 Tax=Desulfomonile tiedjei TaxID=2358 RepID=UPI00338F1008